MKPFPFLVGRGRSGTTLLRAILDAHPEIAVLPEAPYILTMAKGRESYEASEGFRTDRFVTHAVQHHKFRFTGLSEEELRRTLEATRPRSLAEAVRVLYKLYATRQGATLYADKTPAWVFDIPLAAGVFPESRFIHLIRDGRDVALSYLSVSFGDRAVSEAAIGWKRAVSVGRDAGRELGPTRYMEILYEELVTETESVVGSLCDFIGVTFDERMLHPHERAETIVATATHPDAHQNLYRPPTPGLRDWRTEMSPADVELFEVIAGDLLGELGYERRHMVPSLRTRVRAGLAYPAVALIHARDRAKNIAKRTVRSLGRV